MLRSVELDRDRETDIHDCHGRAAYWTAEAELEHDRPHR